MKIQFKPQLIDDLKRRDHSYLDASDKCFFFTEFYSGQGYHGDGNKLITNLKKKPSKKGTLEWKYKEKSIEDCADLILNGFGANLLSKCAFVPIPPSKHKDDPHHDDCLMQILFDIQKKSAVFQQNIKIFDFLNLKTSRSEMSTADIRLTPQEHENNLNFDVSKIQDTGELRAILLFDDVLVTGAQFKGAKNLILKNLLNIDVIGIFIARRVPKHQTELS